ncbi:MAG TPA: CapA family protein [Acidimicrobiales bacterium]|nr:CapA family protein [Acidimicrobiales bacterium]
MTAQSRGASTTVALLGDTMLGRRVGERLDAEPDRLPVAEEVIEQLGEADLVVANLECAISERGEPFAMPGKPFFFRAPPLAAEVLARIGVDCVTLANNHALDFGPDALVDTLAHLDKAGIAATGAGEDERSARQPAVLHRGDFDLTVVAVGDHPAEYAAGPDRPGIAYAPLRAGIPDWLAEAVAGAGGPVLASPHWGPNMVHEPLAYVRAAGAALAGAGATVVAGHSAHVLQGVAGRVLYDLGDFLDDYATDPVERNDLGLAFFLTFEGDVPIRLEAVPLRLEYCFTRLARGGESAVVAERFRQRCAAFGTEVLAREGRLVIEWSPGA